MSCSLSKTERSIKKCSRYFVLILVKGKRLYDFIFILTWSLLLNDDGREGGFIKQKVHFQFQEM